MSGAATPVRLVLAESDVIVMRRLESLVRRSPGTAIVGRASGCTAALDQAALTEPDLVIMDVRMPDGDAFETLDEMARLEAPPEIVLLSAFDAPAARAFDAGVADFVLKPVDPQRLELALGRVRARIAAREAEARIAELNAVIATLRSGSQTDTPTAEREFWVRDKDRMLRVPVEQVDWIQAERDYVRLHIRDRSYLLRETMERVSSRLEGAAFMRVHRSSLVRLDRALSLRRSTSGVLHIQLSGGAEIRVGRRYSADVSRAIGMRTG